MIIRVNKVERKVSIQFEYENLETIADVLYALADRYGDYTLEYETTNWYMGYYNLNFTDPEIDITTLGSSCCNASTEYAGEKQ